MTSDVLTTDAPIAEDVAVITWIEVRGNASNPEDRRQVVTPFSEVLAFEVR